MAFAGFSPGEAEGLRRAMSRKRSAAAIEAHHQRFVEGAMARWHDVDEALAERVFAMVAGFSGLRLPQGPRRRVRPARLPVDLAARALRPGVPVRAARRAADGLLPARRARPRGPAARHRGARRRTSTPARSGCTVDAPRARVRLGLGYVLGVQARRGRGARRRARGRRALPLARRTSPRARAPGGRRWSSSPGRAPATRLAGEHRYARREALWRLGVAAPGRRRAGRARSSRWRSTCPRRPSCDPLGAGTRCSPTTRRPG